jgi:hypothetical protein
MVAEREAKQTKLPKLEHIPQMHVEEMYDKIEICSDMLVKPCMHQESTKTYYSKSLQSLSRTPDISFYSYEMHESMSDFAPEYNDDDIQKFLEALDNDICFMKGILRVPTIDELENLGLRAEIIEILKEITQGMPSEQIDGIIAEVLICIADSQKFILDTDKFNFLSYKVSEKEIGKKDIKRVLELTK